MICLVPIFACAESSEFAENSELAEDDRTVDEENYIIEGLEPVKIQELKNGSKIIIESAEQKAKVYINGIYQGKTRLEVSNLLPGEYLLELKKGENKTKRRFVTVRRGYALTYRIEF